MSPVSVPRMEMQVATLQQGLGSETSPGAKATPTILPHIVRTNREVCILMPCNNYFYL